MRRSESRPARVPVWVWPFAMACFAIPVISLGGAIPAGLGVGGGFYCLAVSRESRKTTHLKLAHCGATVALAWTLFLVVVGGVTALFPDSRVVASDRPAHERIASEPVTEVPGPGRTTTTANSRPSTAPTTRGADDLDDTTRREIYARAVSLRGRIREAEARELDFRSKGMGDVAARQVQHIRGMHEDRQDFYAKFYKISRADLDRIVALGDRQGWPQD